MSGLKQQFGELSAGLTGQGTGTIDVSGVPEGLDGHAVAALVAAMPASAEGEALHVHVARDDRRLEAMAGALAFFAPTLQVIALPAWDCVPYDRVSPNGELVTQRISALARLAAGRRKKPAVVLTTVNALVQRMPAPEVIRSLIKVIAPGQRLDMTRLAARLSAFGYVRTGTVMDTGEFALRGGIADLFPPGRSRPVRLDFFGDTLESIKYFDPQTQRTLGTVNRLVLLPVSELVLNKTTIRSFRQRYVELFGPATSDDPLYEAVSNGSRYPGMEHWLSLFHDHLAALQDYVQGATFSFDHNVDDAVKQRLEQIEEHYQARIDGLEQEAFGAPPYKPVPIDSMFVSGKDLKALFKQHRLFRFSPFESGGDSASADISISIGGRLGHNFATDRSQEGVNLYDAVAAHIKNLQGKGKRVVIAGWTAGSCERLAKLLGEHGAGVTARAENWPEIAALDKKAVGVAVLEVEQGFIADDFAIIAEQDIVGDRLVRKRRRQRSVSDVLTEASALNIGDLVVHADHGIGRFTGLQRIEAAGAPHDCLELVYHGGDKLYLPVENIELLTRYGADESNTQLDRLGGASWQSRKSRLKQRIRDIAEKLIQVAALRELKKAPVLTPPEGAYDEFCARFQHEETDDQLTSLEAVRGDLGSGRPMDRLICGDVGFGKTEVALRASFAVAMNGKQVAVVVPTTLLARQHYKTFSERFEGYPIEVRQVSRLVGAKELAETREGIRNGTVDIIVGTHALLSKRVEFSDLGLLIIDEEQHFGVQHKEQLKQLRDDVHVLTLTATPIPRTLQLALSGVRELSLITTPPVDRLAVRTYVTPFDPVILREALLRERYRGGQTFYVCPRISDLDDIAAFLREYVSELKVAVAHGQMPPGQLDEVMNAFYDGSYDVLLSTTIVESGLDIPRANTLIVHRSEMYGLAQLYQLRGRVGRAKARAYAYFTLPANKRLTERADKRLKVLQSLDTLGAGFSLASHDLDIRGAGNLLGEEQSGHIREVGFELYQAMLEEAIAALKQGDGTELEDQWSPQISIGTAALLPEIYVADLQVRLGLYRRLSRLETRSEMEEFAEELVDRFGPLPGEVEHLLEIMEIKGLCRRAGIAQIDAGPRGASLSFRHNEFANPLGLLEFVQKNSSQIKIQPDQKLIYLSDWGEAAERLVATRNLVHQIAEIAEATPEAEQTALAGAAS